MPDPVAAPFAAGLLAITATIAWARGWLLAARAPSTSAVSRPVSNWACSCFCWWQCLEHLGPRPSGLFAPLTAIFFALGLIGLRFARALESGSAERFRTASTVLAVVGIALVIAIGFLVRSEIDRDFIDLLLTPVFWLWNMLGRILLFLINLLPKPDLTNLPVDPGFGHLPAPPEPHPRTNFFEWLRILGGIMFYSSVAWMFGMVLFQSLFRLLRWLQRRRDPSLDLSIEKSEFGLLDEFAALLRALAALWARLTAWRFHARPKGPPEARTIRDVYRRLLAWAASHGHAKAAHQTAHEFMETLRPAVPERTFELRFVTEAYVAARYGDVRPDPGLIDRIRSAWRRLRTTRPHTAV